MCQREVFKAVVSNEVKEKFLNHPVGDIPVLTAKKFVNLKIELTKSPKRNALFIIYLYWSYDPGGTLALEELKLKLS